MTHLAKLTASGLQQGKGAAHDYRSVLRGRLFLVPSYLSLCNLSSIAASVSACSGRGWGQGGANTPITLVFSAFNEARSIQEKLENIARLKARHPDLEVLAYDDGSSDGTLAAMQARPELLEVIVGEGRQGKAHGMKKLAARAKGDIVIFTDANVLLDEDAVDRIRFWHGDPDVGGLCGNLRYLGADTSTTASVGGAYWRLEEKIKDMEAQTGSVMGADGSIFAIRRALYPDFPDTVLDDFTVSMNVVFRGFRLIKCNDVIAYERLVASRSDEFSRKVRIAARAFHTHQHLSPQLGRMSLLNRFKYVSHKLLRWFGGLFLILALLSFLGFCFALSLWLGVLAVILLILTVTLASRTGFTPSIPSLKSRFP
ncbi:glycosyltransferase [Gemmobacter lanyuensis]